MQGSCDSLGHLQHHSSTPGHRVCVVSQAAQGDVGWVELRVSGGVVALYKAGCPRLIDDGARVECV